MCGIAGVVGWADADDAVRRTTRMVAALAHRGPDDTGVETVRLAGAAGPVTVLGHRRLSIIDTSPAGHQPMCDRALSAEGACVTFNGEVYNYRELAPDLVSPATPYRGGSDTEVLVRAWQRWGVDCLPRLNGMFAFAVADRVRGRLFLARDRLGIKPLYYLEIPGRGLLFASELRALVDGARGATSLRLDRAGVSAFLAQGYVAEPRTLVDGARLLPPGHVLTVDPSGCARPPTPFWSPAPGDARTEDELVETLADAVRLRLRSDVPLAVFLSSGLDSSIIAALARRGETGVLKTVTVGFDEFPELDESAAAQRISAHLGTENLKVTIGRDELLDRFGRYLDAMDQPTVDGFNSYVICHRAAEAGFTVVLSGLGGDELFAGYATFRDVPRLLRLGPLARMAAAAAGWSAGNRTRFKVAHLGAPRPLDLTSLCLWRREVFVSSERRRLLAPPPDGVDPELGLPAAYVDGLRALAAGAGPDVVTQISTVEIAGYMRNLLLRDNDVFSMAHGVELRVPFLDHRVVEAALSFGGGLTTGRGPKPLLRRAFRAYLPPPVVTTRKMGFAFPWEAWLRGPLRARVDEAVDDRAAWRDLGLDAGAVADTCHRFQQGDRRLLPLQVLAFIVLTHIRRRYGLAL